MKNRFAIILVATALALTGCSATTASATRTPAPQPTATTAAQGIKAAQAAIAALSSAEQDKVFLAGVRKMIPDGTDATLIAAGHKACEAKAAGLVNEDLIASVNALGFTGTQGLMIVVSASLAYCPPK